MEYCITWMKSLSTLKNCVILSFFIGAILPLFMRGTRVDPNLWLHLRTGQQILETHRVPRQDHFSAASYGHGWIDHEWGTEVLLAMIHRRWGLTGVALATALVATLTCLVVFALAHHLTGRATVALAGSTIVALGMQPFVDGFPRVVSCFFFALLFLLLLRARTDVTAGKGAWAAPVIIVLWANSHGAVVMGLVLLGIHWLCEEIEGPSAASTAAVASLRRLRLLFPACVLASLANPYGYHLLEVPFQYLDSPLLRSIITGWRPPDLLDTNPGLILILGLLALVASLGLRDDRRRTADVCLALLVTYMALMSRRHIPFFLIGIVPIVALAVDAALRKTAERALAVRSLVRLLSCPPLPRLGLTLKGWSQDHSGVYCIPLMIVILSTRSFAITPASSVQIEKYPVRAANFLATQHLHGNLYNPYDWGSYFIYRLYPKYHVFIDGRFPLVHDEVTFHHYTTIYNGDPGWERLAERYGLRVLVCRRDVVGLREKAGRSSHWRQVYEDDMAVIFRRVAPAAGSVGPVVDQRRRQPYYSEGGHTNLRTESPRQGDSAQFSRTVRLRTSSALSATKRAAVWVGPSDGAPAAAPLGR
jgi:hypothetical protein